MKLTDFSLVDETEREELLSQIAQFNQTHRAYPRQKTVHQLFVEQAQKTPHATAVIGHDRTLTYAELDQRANQLAHFLLATGLVQRETCLGLLMGRTPEVVVAILGILKAGGAYVPLDPQTPFERLKYILRDVRAPFLLTERQYLRTANRLQWECPELSAIYCADSQHIYEEIESDGGLMDEQMWAYVAEETFDDISGGGWKSSYTGEWLSREVMDEYGENIRLKLAPHLTAESRLFEVGVASGISMFRLAPEVGYFYGTDLSAGIIEWTGAEAASRHLTNTRLEALAAHEIDQAGEGDFDVVIINSVIECFTGHNYLRDVLRKAIDLVGEQGWLFLGNVWDQDLKEDFVQSLIEFKQAHAGQGYVTKTDRSDELFVSRRYLEDLRHEWAEIADIEYSQMIGTAESELSLYGFDALVKIDKRVTQPTPTQPRHKYQYDRRALAAHPTTGISEQTHAEGLAYVIYTSGSTGRPKGVMVEHRPILRLVCNTNYITLTADDCILQTGSIAFDASTLELWGALLNGSRLCFATQNQLLDFEQLRQLIAQHQVTTMWLTASLFNQLVETDGRLLTGLKTVLVGGERLTPHYINQAREQHPQLALINGYGPTENTTFSATYAITTSFEHDIPIGRPIANSTAYVLDDNLQPVPLGTAGELCVGGEGLARGYLGDSQRTAQKFVQLPFAPHERIYRTGDLVRQLPEGDLIFLGRVDNQVKIRGFRIEPEEIEATLLRHEEIKEATVLVKTYQQKELVAYIVSPLTVDEVRTYLKRELPPYMIPPHIMLMPHMPLNQNGKVDRRALPEPDTAAAQANYVPPQTETEKILVDIWQAVLDRQAIGITDNFFDMGGHSLKVTKLIAQIQTRLGVTVPLAAVFKAPTIRRLAQILLDQATYGYAIADDPLILLNEETTGQPLFALPPGTGDALGFIQLADLFKPRPFYAFNFIEAPNRLQQYADLIIESEAEEPYLLFGYSSGGNLAYHVAHELEKRGRAVAAVIMADSSRWLYPFSVGDEKVLQIAEEFMGHESIQPYLQSPVLVEKLVRQIQRSYAYIAQSIDEHTIQADIVVLVCAEEARLDEYYEDGRLIASTAAWAEATHGRFEVVRGAGTHNDMLYPPHLATNVEHLRQIISRYERA